MRYRQIDVGRDFDSLPSLMARSSTNRHVAKGSGRYVALLRGINVGGKNKLPMKDLAAIFAEAGCADVVTYIQSGNVVFSASPACAKRLQAEASGLIADRLGLRVPVILRTAAELDHVTAANPLMKAGVDPDSLHVAFLADLPARSQVATLDSDRSPGDSFVVRGREVYLCLSNGMARTKLTNAYFDSVLTTTSTIRNWRTVLKLVKLSAGQQ